MSFKLILSDSFRFFRENLRQIVTLCFPFLVAGAIINNILLSRLDTAADASSIFLLWFALTVALYPVYTISLILMMARRAERERPTNAQLIADAMRLYFPFLMLLVVAMGLVWFAGLFLILPGIWLAVRLSFAGFFLVVNRLEPKESLIASFQTTRGYFFQILATLVLFVLASFSLAFLIGNILDAVHAGAALNIIADATISFLTLFLHVVLFRIFMQATHASRQSTVDTQA